MKKARIAVLLIAVAAGGVAAKLAMRPTPAPAPAPAPVAQIEVMDVLIASSDIGLGQTLSPQNIAWQSWPASSQAATLIKKTNRPNAIKELSGTRARVAFSAGEPILDSKLVRAGSGFLAAILPKGMRAVATPISPENGAGGFILPGDHVDVLLTRASGSARAQDSSTAETILWNVQVLAIDHDIAEKGSQNVATGKIATLALTPRQAETIVLAHHLGTISLALRSIDDFGATPNDDAANLGSHEEINVVRYGVSGTTAH
jgi:pilus assembly protein CpaB